MKAHVLLLVAVLAVVVATPVAAERSAAKRPLEVGMVAPVIGLGEPGLINEMYLGLRRAVAELGVTGRVLTPGPKEDFGPTLAYLARQGYDAVIMGFFSSEDVERVAPSFPRTSFIVPDVPLAQIRHPAGNVRSIVFRPEQAAYLAGYLAALMETLRPGRDVVSTVGGARLPGVDRFIAGFRAGARKAVPGITLLNGYTDDFLDTRRCAAVARSQIARGSGVVFQVADRCGLGALAVARAKGLWGVGVDVDQSYLGEHILTSVVKRHDVAVFDTIKALQDRSFPLGGTTVLTLANGGVALGRISRRVPAAFVAAVERVRRQIVRGEIVVPTSVS